MHDPIQQFRNAIAASGITIPGHIKRDGKIHRFSSSGKRGDTAGWYVFHDGDIPSGAFGCWRLGISQTWRADIGRKFTAAEEAAHKAKMEAIKKQREEEEAIRHAEAAIKAKDIWNKADLAIASHPYLAKKGVNPHGIRECGGNLIIPLCIGQDIHSLHIIWPDGTKRFLTGGRISGCHFIIGNLENADTLCIVEGFATGASVYEATGLPVVVAFNTGNLKHVAVALSKRFPGIRLILCADDDYRTEGNPGITKATEVAREVNGVVAIPGFGENRPEGATDFNDLYQSQGLDAVKEAIEAAIRMNSRPLSPESGLVPMETLGEAIRRLGGLAKLEYAQARKAEAKHHGITLAALDELVADERSALNVEDTSPFPNIEPWPEAVDPGALLSGIAAAIRRFIVCEPETIHAATLWVAFTWFIEVVHVAPLAIITAPEKRCGKSQLLFLLEKMVCRPLAASNITPAALFRSIDKWQPTMLIDEADSFMRENEELRGLINCGHTRESAFSIRTVGENHTPTRFNLWGAKALAGIGKLADTVMDRGIVLELRRKTACEHVDKRRHAETDLFPVLQRKLARFAEDYAETIKEARPDIPDALHDRAADNWEPLLAIADAAGGEWPELARKAAIKLSDDNESGQSRGSELLADIREVFEISMRDRIFSRDLLAALVFDDEKPWSTYNRGKPITARQLAKRLGEYGIKSKTLRIEHERALGFEKNQFDDAFKRYLAPHAPESAVTRDKSPEAAQTLALGVTEDYSEFI